MPSKVNRQSIAAYESPIGSSLYGTFTPLGHLTAAAAHHQHRDAQGVAHRRDGLPENQAGHATMPVGTHHQHVDAGCLYSTDDRIVRLVCGYAYNFRISLKTGSLIVGQQGVAMVNALRPPHSRPFDTTTHRRGKQSPANHRCRPNQAVRPASHGCRSGGGGARWPAAAGPYAWRRCSG